MAKISSLILCESVQPAITQNANGGFDISPNIMSPFPSIQPIAVPSNYSFAIFFTICEINYKDKSAQNNLQLKIVAPNGNVIFSSAIISISSDMLSGDTFSYSIDFRNFVFMQEGEYTINVFYNDENLYTQKFDVKRKEMVL